MPAMVRDAAIVHSSGYHCDIGVHVFPMEKFGLLRRRLVTEGHVADSAILEPAPASREDLARVHGAEYLDDLEGLRWTRRTKSSELPLTAGIVRAYRLAAGGTTLAAREALARGFGVNLGGGFHHAHADHAEGFCYLNDIAVAIRALQHEGGVRRVAVVDCDVHQGNGTASLFRGDDTVFTFSIHQEYNYPSPKEPATSTSGSRTAPVTTSTWRNSGARSSASGRQSPGWSSTRRGPMPTARTNWVAWA